MEAKGVHTRFDFVDNDDRESAGDADSDYLGECPKLSQSSFLRTMDALRGMSKPGEGTGGKADNHRGSNLGIGAHQITDGQREREKEEVLHMLGKNTKVSVNLLSDNRGDNHPNGARSPVLREEQKAGGVVAAGDGGKDDGGAAAGAGAAGDKTDFLFVIDREGAMELGHDDVEGENVVGRDGAGARETTEEIRPPPSHDDVRGGATLSADDNSITGGVNGAPPAKQGAEFHGEGGGDGDSAARTAIRNGTETGKSPSGVALVGSLVLAGTMDSDAAVAREEDEGGGAKMTEILSPSLPVTGNTGLRDGTNLGLLGGDNGVGRCADVEEVILTVAATLEVAGTKNNIDEAGCSSDVEIICVEDIPKEGASPEVQQKAEGEDLSAGSLLPPIAGSNGKETHIEVVEMLSDTEDERDCNRTNNTDLDDSADKMEALRDGNSGDTVRGWEDPIELDLSSDSGDSDDDTIYSSSRTNESLSVSEEDRFQISCVMPLDSADDESSSSPPIQQRSHKRQSIGPTGETRRKVVAALRRLGKKLSKSDLTHTIDVRRMARVPIIAVGCRLGFDFDIAVGGHNGADTSRYAASQVKRHKR